MAIHAPCCVMVRARPLVASGRERIVHPLPCFARDGSNVPSRAITGVVGRVLRYRDVNRRCGEIAALCGVGVPVQGVGGPAPMRGMPVPWRGCERPVCSVYWGARGGKEGRACAGSDFLPCCCGYIGALPEVAVSGRAGCLPVGCGALAVLPVDRGLCGPAVLAS